MYHEHGHVVSRVRTKAYRGSGKYTGTAEEIVAEYQQALKDAGMDIVIEELQKQLTEVYGDAE